MDVVTIILSAAKSVGVSGSLLLAICNHESGGFKYNYTAHDKGSPSYGVCQIKLNSAKQLGFHGNPRDLMNPKINARFAALYLKYQQSRYGKNDWCVLAASYNSGSYSESKKYPGFPKNLKYVKLVQKKLPSKLRYRLQCGEQEMADN